MTRAFRLSTIAAAALVGGSFLLRLVDPFGAPPPSPEDLVPHLWGIAALLTVALTRSWAPAVAWVALVIGAAASALGAVGLVRDIRTATGDDQVPLLGAIVTVALLVAPAIGAAYATHDGHRSRPVIALAWGTVLVLGGALSIAFVARAMGGEGGGVPEWSWMAVIAVLLVTGLTRDLGPVAGRTRARTAAPGATGRGRDAAGPTGGGATGAGALSVARIFLDELVPGREAARAAAAEAERGRIAADLHADVLPALRQALAEAEAGGTVERLAADLRSAVDEVESLLTTRRSIVLEELGLVPALEWLAERVEERSPVRVEIEVDEAGPSDGRPPREVERAAFRIAQLALDNVVRHAPGATVRVAVAAGSTGVRLRVVDDASSPPIDETGALRRGRRGIADMRAEARACGAAVEVGRGRDDLGTLIGLRWPA